MARPAQTFWQLAYRLHPDEPVEQGGGAGPGVCPVAGGANPGDPDRRRLPGQRHGQSASRWHRGFKKSGPQSTGRSRGGRTTKIHLVAANDRCVLSLSISPGNAGDAPQGRELLRNGGPVPQGCPLIMDRAYEGDEAVQLARGLGYSPVVSPNPNRRATWEYDRVLYLRRNEIERLFRRPKAYRRVFSRFENFDVLFVGFIVFFLISEALRFSVKTP